MSRPDFLSRSAGAIFDLDGVIVDTAKYHFLAWRRLAADLGFEFTAVDNERLKGVSRMRSLEILLEVGGIDVPGPEKQEMAARKNTWYVEMISRMGPDEILSGAREYLVQLRSEGKRIALGSASKNAPTILARVGILELFDAVIDGNAVATAKPDPEVFLLGARSLGLAPADCVVYEDAQAGIEAALRAGMSVVAIGDPRVLHGAHLCVPGLHALVAG